MNCGFCGTQVNNGFTVCSACGANYRVDLSEMLGGVISIVIGLFSIKTMFIGGLIFIGVGVFLIKDGSTGKWYRKNA
ncbi:MULTISPECIES: hypothetical protein [unclassified Vibrio]|uniref:hypothetical protein n=1 Tax=unclassified Vibrio TaxID=2614977 RepID=UPI000B8EA320|nr:MULTISPECIES: hypothetical protein [unclassified Vibrio]NAW91733.1 hypothetical protein [Vibrio sp. V24_P1S3T111]OXX19153.1 hypothetical protein B9J86_16235 [Vibrio sp. V06_P1A73T115]OXX36273.1 hypothetical protein B9J81_06265 [Vibrio sp. V04_P4A5T148]OXX55092.1 hypothetical protein B9J91_10075 [Vibrio sp. V18_P1S4T112]OXX72057.1 hypothetical protein B9J87_09670 [Vibrio sp. V19_P1S1T109]